MEPGFPSGVVMKTLTIMVNPASDGRLVENLIKEIKGLAWMSSATL